MFQKGKRKTTNRIPARCYDPLAPRVAAEPIASRMLERREGTAGSLGDVQMRIFALVSVASVSLAALPVAVSAQTTMPSEQTADDLNRQSAPALPNTVVTHDPNTGAPNAVISNYPGNMVTAPPMDMNKSYPVCTGKIQDNCQNRGEGGAPGKSRARTN